MGGVGSTLRCDRTAAILIHAGSWHGPCPPVRTAVWQLPRALEAFMADRQSDERERQGGKKHPSRKEEREREEGSREEGERRRRERKEEQSPRPRKRT